MKHTADQKLMAVRCRLLTMEPWYGHMAMSMKWKQSDMSWIPEQARSIGIRISSEHQIECLFYGPWVESKSCEQLFGAVEHLVNHLVRLHALRTQHRIPQAWHMACDMVVNGRKSDPRIGYKAESPTVLPHDKMIFIPDKWPENETADHYYNLLLKEAEKHPIPPGSGEDGHMEIGEFSGDMIDNHQIWMQTEISVDEARQMINERVKNANEKAQGHVPGHLKEALEELKKPIVRWREQLKAFLGTHVGNRRRTYSRPDRRQDAFGTKGISHHAACDVTVIVDTSGSISKDELEQFFGEIECIAYRAKVNLVGWDAGLQFFQKYRRGAWRTIEVRGGGGTDMAAPVAWAEEHGAMGDVGVMLTDGYCNWPEQRPYPFIYCITTSEDRTQPPSWGLVVRLKAEE